MKRLPILLPHLCGVLLCGVLLCACNNTATTVTTPSATESTVSQVLTTTAATTAEKAEPMEPAELWEKVEIQNDGWKSADSIEALNRLYADFAEFYTQTMRCEELKITFRIDGHEELIEPFMEAFASVKDKSIASWNDSPALPCATRTAIPRSSGRLHSEPTSSMY